MINHFNQEINLSKKKLDRAHLCPKRGLDDIKKTEKESTYSNGIQLTYTFFLSNTEDLMRVEGVLVFKISSLPINAVLAYERSIPTDSELSTSL